MLDAGNETMTDDGQALDDLAYAEVQRLRARRETAADTHYSGLLADRVQYMWKVHQDAFEKDFWDFTWLLEEGVRRDVKWSGDYCAVDEINDLNALQATLAARIEGTDVEYVGDLDQAIYGFAGVDPKQVLGLLRHDEQEVMELSYRLTPPIAAAAERCLAQASWRSDGRIKTIRTGGIYHPRDIVENVFAKLQATPEKYGDTYVIGRTNWIVSQARAMAIERGMNVAQSGEEEALRDFCAFIMNPEDQFPYRLIPAVTAPFLPAADYFQRGAKAALQRLHDDDPSGKMPWGQFYEKYGTDRLKRTLAGEWTDWYRGRVIDPSKPVIRFDTFHAAKGMEADTVVCLTDITERVENEGIADEEIRLAYVAITRARQHVFPASMWTGWHNRWLS